MADLDSLVQQLAPRLRTWFLGMGRTAHLPRSSGELGGVAIDVSGSGGSITLADTAQALPFGNGNAFGGLIIVHETAVDGAIGMFLTGGSAIAEISDPSGLYTTTGGNAGTINVYLSSLIVVLQNNRGGSRTFNVFGLRLRDQN